MFYPKLAFTNLKKNGKTYIPYIMTCILTVMMFYVMHAIGNNPGLLQMSGAREIKMILSWCVVLTGIFSVILLFYTNSFLIKQRKKEFGLYQVLGMDKKNLAKMMTWETILTCIVGLIGGLALGLLFGKLMFLLLLKIMRFEITLKFAIMPQSLLTTVILFTCIFIATLLFNLLQVQTANPIALLHGGQHGEKEPKTNWFLTSFGVITVGTGYFIAQTTESPATAIGTFFIAVILVVVGTYALFTAGSIMLLKKLKKSKNFYYQTKHFTSVSGMIYRMKQNAVGLANICIMSTVVLVLISVSISLYAGMEDIMETRFPTEFKAEIRNAEESNLSKAEQVIEEELQKSNVKAVDRLSYKGGGLPAALDKNGNKLILDSNVLEMTYTMGEYYNLQMIPLSDFNEMEEENITLEKGQVLVYVPDGKFQSDTITLEDMTYDVKQVLSDMKVERVNTSNVIKSMYVVFSDVDSITQMMTQYGGQGNNRLSFVEQFNVEGDQKTADQTMGAIKNRMSEEVLEGWVEYRAEYSQQFYQLYGGFLFLGIFVGSLFLMATVLIIYYKQISEGYDDQSRYQIMQKVGMSRQEIKRSIKSQVLMVFFLPLGVAVIHVAVAFKVVTKLLSVLNLVNVPLFFVCTIGTVLVFAVFYAVVFLVTSREYYKIVQ